MPRTDTPASRDHDPNTSTATLADEYARRGLDWEAQLRQRAKELALVTALGLTPASVLPSSQPVEEEPDAEDQPANRRDA